MQLNVHLISNSIFGHKIAPDGIGVWNPSFDVTPSSLITGIITEVGVALKGVHDNGVIDLTDFLTKYVAAVGSGMS